MLAFDCGTALHFSVPVSSVGTATAAITTKSRSSWMTRRPVSSNAMGGRS